jgi:hypothetical protein
MTPAAPKPEDSALDCCAKRHEASCAIHCDYECNCISRDGREELSALRRRAEEAEARVLRLEEENARLCAENTVLIHIAKAAGIEADDEEDYLASIVAPPPEAQP